MDARRNNHNNSFVHFEITPRTYYEHYSEAAPSYDLYPALSRRLGNGYVHRPSLKRHDRLKQLDFAAMNLRTFHRPHPMLDHFAQLPEEAPNPNEHRDQVDSVPPWDLYPLLLRNVSITYIFVNGICRSGWSWLKFLGSKLWNWSNEATTPSSYDYYVKSAEKKIRVEKERIRRRKKKKIWRE